MKSGRCESCGVCDGNFVIRDVVLGKTVADSWRAAGSMKEAKRLLNQIRFSIISTTGNLPLFHGPVEIITGGAFDGSRRCQQCTMDLEGQRRADKREQNLIAARSTERTLLTQKEDVT